MACTRGYHRICDLSPLASSITRSFSEHMLDLAAGSRRENHDDGSFLELKSVSLIAFVAAPLLPPVQTLAQIWRPRHLTTPISLHSLRCYTPRYRNPDLCSPLPQNSSSPCCAYIHRSWCYSGEIERQRYVPRMTGGRRHRLRPRIELL